MKRNNIPYMPGGTLLLCALLSLCLWTLSAISLSSANYEYKQAALHYTALTEKENARNLAEEMLEDYNKEGTENIGFAVKINDNKTLLVNAEERQGELVITEYKTVFTGQWNPEETIPVFQP